MAAAAPSPGESVHLPSSYILCCGSRYAHVCAAHAAPAANSPASSRCPTHSNPHLRYRDVLCCAAVCCAMRRNLEDVPDLPMILSDKVLNSQCQLRFDLNGAHKDNLYGERLGSGVRSAC
jgi:hypothetical protein